MTLCVVTKGHCLCQPDEGVFCPDYKPDAYVRYLMDAITELRGGSHEWISLKDQDPDVGQTVVLWDAMFQRADIRLIEVRPLDPDYTHWMPLPPSPSCERSEG